MFELKTEYLKLKYQAIQCSIANIKYVKTVLIVLMLSVTLQNDFRPFPESQWSNEATDHFLQLSHCALWKVVLARVLEHGDTATVVELLDTAAAGERDLNIGQELVTRGLAASAVTRCEE